MPAIGSLLADANTYRKQTDFLLAAHRWQFSHLQAASLRAAMTLDVPGGAWYITNK